MFTVLAEIIGWIATFFRGAGMLAKKPNMVKYLVSIGNLCWFINGALTSNTPLMASNGFCLIVMLYEIFKPKLAVWFAPVTRWFKKVGSFFKSNFVDSTEKEEEPKKELLTD